MLLTIYLIAAQCQNNVILSRRPQAANKTPTFRGRLENGVINRGDLCQVAADMKETGAKYSADVMNTESS